MICIHEVIMATDHNITIKIWNIISLTQVLANTHLIFHSNVIRVKSINHETHFPDHSLKSEVAYF
jgi:hypothetical protein